MLNLHNLDPVVRTRMLGEIVADESVDVYVSPRLTDRGLRDYLGLLREAVTSHDAAWLTARLNEAGRLKSHEERRTKSGTTQVKVPHTAAETLAEGDFNRYYVRAVCLVAIAADPEAEVEVYRAKAVASPRAESTALLGRRLRASAVLHDLLAHRGDLATALGVPAGPNSGLSVRFVKTKTVRPQSDEPSGATVAT